MNYQIVHRTNYRYGAPVSRCRNEAHLRPRDTDRQHCLASHLAVEPEPASCSERSDYFGNTVNSFAVEGPFVELTVTSTSSVSVFGGQSLPVAGPGWEQARDSLATDLSAQMLSARQFCFESPLVPPSTCIREYAELSFPTGRTLLDAVIELTERIFVDFHYDPGFTTVTTPMEEVLRYRRGVCQDFAHLAIGCMRSMGLAARYVSGYLETTAPVGESRLQGADASHAWPSMFIPGWGWLDIDPTNKKVIDTTYVTTAWGRDYSDVSPVKGIVFGGGDSQMLEVSVDVTRTSSAPSPDAPGAITQPSHTRALRYPAGHDPVPDL